MEAADAIPLGCMKTPEDVREWLMEYARMTPFDRLVRKYSQEYIRTRDQIYRGLQESED